MLTPQEIQEKGFNKAVFGGYVMDEVDEFVEAVYTDYSTVIKENAVLKSKIKVLVEKLEQYRDADDTMRSALANAQKNSEAMYRETREKCRRLTRETEDKAKKTISDMQARVAAEEQRLANISANANQFAAAIRKVMNKQEEYLRELSEIASEAKEKCPKRPVEAPKPQPKQKQEKKPLPPIPQPDIDLSLDDSTDTQTAEEINSIVSAIMNENKSAETPKPQKPEMAQKPGRVQQPDKPKKPETAPKPEKPGKPENVQRPEPPQKPATRSGDDKFDFKSMKFTK